MRPQNLHTHTTFCDGKSTAEEMVLGSIEAGCSAIGFSGHSPLPFPNEWCMTDTVPYRREIERLKAAYAGQIDIFLGIEQDLFSPSIKEPYDYVLGSVHILKKNGVLFSVDESAEVLKAAADTLYEGDFFALCEDYYEAVAQLPKKTGCQILGHLDLPTKFNEPSPLFSEEDPRYRAAALGAIEALLPTGVFFEINTGAMSRGYRTAPYPAAFLLKAIYEGGGKIVFTGDSHSADAILYGYGDAVALAQQCGFESAMYLTPEGFTEGPLPTIPR